MDRKNVQKDSLECTICKGKIFNSKCSCEMVSCESNIHPRCGLKQRSEKLIQTCKANPREEVCIEEQHATYWTVA